MRFDSVSLYVALFHLSNLLWSEFQLFQFTSMHFTLYLCSAPCSCFTHFQHIMFDLCYFKSLHCTTLYFSLFNFVTCSVTLCMSFNVTWSHVISVSILYMLFHSTVCHFVTSACFKSLHSMLYHFMSVHLTSICFTPIRFVSLGIIVCESV